MAAPTRVTHLRRTRAPARTVFELVADVSRWPVIFGPTVHVDVLERGAGHERFRIWALVNGRVANWTSRRTFDSERLVITFHQEHSTPPIAAMSGSWHFRDLGEDGTEITLHHDFATVDGSAESIALVTGALDRNSDSELAALARVAEFGRPVDDVVFAFEDSIEVAAGPKAVYDFIDQARKWPYRLPHVDDVELREEVPGVQLMTMRTVTADGAAHQTASVRLCTPAERIVYKQTTPPAQLVGHSGAWYFEDRGPAGTLVTARHLVCLQPPANGGDGGSGRNGAGEADSERALAELAGRMERALRANSRQTLAHAKAFSE
jgi:aromatase